MINISYILHFFYFLKNRSLYFSINGKPTYPGIGVKFGGKSSNALSAIFQAVDHCCTQKKLSISESTIKERLTSQSNGHPGLMHFNKCRISPGVSIEFVEKVESPKHHNTISDVFVICSEDEQATKKYHVCCKSDTQTDPDIEIYRVRIKISYQTNLENRKRKISSE